MSSRPTIDAEQRRKADLDAQNTPSVGIFWFVTIDGKPELLAYKTPWPEAEDYGDFKTEAKAHYTLWPSLRRNLKLAGEYEDWPRGRVVYDTRKDRFTAYIDRQLTADAFRTSIINYFCLPLEKTTFAFDAHYSGAKFKLTGCP
jgi:hypothetical protein